MSSESLLSDREPPQFLSIPKRSGGVRRLTVLGPEDARAYGAEVARASGTIERALGPEVFANRARPGRRFALEPWGPAWRRFVRARQSLVSTGRVVVKADVRECYPSIRPKVVERMLLRLGCRARDVGMLRRWLDGFQDLGVSGLPIGPEPSAVLANAVLAPVDGALRRAGCSHVRWVDDVWAAVSDPNPVLASLRAALNELGLELNERKTEILGPGEAAGRFRADVPSWW